MSKQTKNNKYNRAGTGANQAVFGAFVDNTEIQGSVNTNKKKKKASLRWIPNIHINKWNLKSMMHIAKEERTFYEGISIIC